MGTMGGSAGHLSQKMIVGIFCPVSLGGPALLRLLFPLRDDHLPTVPQGHTICSPTGMSLPKVRKAYVTVFSAKLTSGAYRSESLRYAAWVFHLAAAQDQSLRLTFGVDLNVCACRRRNVLSQTLHPVFQLPRTKTTCDTSM